MKKSVQIVRYLAGFLLAMTAIMVATGVVSAMEITDLLGITGVNSFAMAMAVSGGSANPTNKTVKSLEDDDGSLRHFFENEVSKEITKMRPSATPLDTLLRSTNKVVPIRSWETEWYAVDVRATQDTISEEKGAGTYATTPTPHEIKPTNMHMWSVDDNIRVHGVDAKDDKALILHVVRKTSDSLYVIPVNPIANYNVPLIPDEAELTRIGNAKAEIDAQTTPYAIFPSKFNNYCQIHMAQVEESVFAKLHKKEVKHDIYDYQIQSIFDMKRAMEFTSLWGAPAKIYDPEGDEWKYLSGGITHFLTKELTWDSGGFNNAKFMDWGRDTFVGNSGGEKRFMFCGSGLIQALGGSDLFQKQMDSKNTEIVFGVTFSRIETPFGVYMVKHHQLFDDVYMPNHGIVLDINNIEKHTFKPMETRELEFIKSGQKNANAYVIDETFCLATRYPDTHALITYAGTATTTTSA